MSSTPTYLKTTSWVRDVLFGSRERLDLIRRWFSGRVSNGGNVVIMSFGRTKEIINALRFHGLLFFVSRVYGLSESGTLKLSIYENPQSIIDGVLLPNDFECGDHPNTAFKKSLLLKHLHCTSGAHTTVFNDDDPKTVAACRDLRGFPGRVCPYGVVRDGLAMEQLSSIVKSINLQ
jgi:hypothetical protein